MDYNAEIMLRRYSHKFVAYFIGGGERDTGSSGQCNNFMQE